MARKTFVMYRMTDRYTTYNVSSFIPFKVALSALRTVEVKK